MDHLAEVGKAYIFTSSELREAQGEQKTTNKWVNDKEALEGNDWEQQYVRKCRLTP
jgi:hypothetical protein